MGITIGDALTVLSIVAALCLSAWAILIGVSLICHNRVAAAADRLTSHTGSCVFWGAVWTFVVGGLSLAALQVPHPLVKILALASLGGLMLLAAVGAGGIVHLIAERIQLRDPGFSGFIGLVRGATTVVLAAMLPVAGWFFLGPLILAGSMGAGLHAVAVRNPRRVSEVS